MSDTIDLREQLARIDRALAETHKFQQETNKLQAEGMKLQQEAAKLGFEGIKLQQEAAKLSVEGIKLQQEAGKLGAERDKLRRDWRLAPWLLAASVGGGVVASLLGQLAQHYWR